MIKRYFQNTVTKAFAQAEVCIAFEVENFLQGKKDVIRILDIGCGIGDNTEKFVSKIPKNTEFEVYGVDHLLKSKIKNKDILYTELDIEKEKYPFKENTFDIIISNQVIEHLLNKDFLLEEAYRVLKKEGVFILATENIASIDNITSLLLGQEPVTQVTGNKIRTNSFLSTSFMQKELRGNKYEHKNVNSYFGLKRLLSVNGFKVVKFKSFGNVCWLLEKMFPIYNKVLLAVSVKV